MSKLMPLADYVLIEPLESEETSASGLVLPETAREKPAKGRVLEVGMTTQVKKDQIVVFKKWGGQDVEDQGKELKLVKFDEIMGVYGEDS